MKKLILFLLASLFALTINAQEYFGEAVRLGVTPVANNADFILANGTHNGKSGVISKTQITVQQMTDAINSSIPTLTQVLNEDNTTSESIDFTGTGEKIEFGFTGNGSSGLTWSTSNENYFIRANNTGTGLGASTSLDFQVVSGIVTKTPFQIGASAVNITEALSVTSAATFSNNFFISNNAPVLTFRDNNNSLRTGSIGLSELTANRNYILPDKPGTFAMTSDVSNISEWAISSGTRAGDNLAFTLGDYDDTSSGTKITLEDENEEIRMEAASLIELKGILKYRSNAATGGLATFQFTGGTDRTYILPSAKGGTFAMTSDIPTSAMFLPYSGALSNANLGNFSLTAKHLFSRDATTPKVEFTNTTSGKVFVITPTATQSANNVTVTGPTENGKLALTSQILQTVKVNITESQLKQNFPSVPNIEIIAAPGANKIIDVHSMVVVYNEGSIAYNTGAARFSIGSAIVHDTYTFSGEVTNGDKVVKKLKIEGAAALEIPANTSFTFSTETGNTAGNGNLDIIITYKVLDI